MNDTATTTLGSDLVAAVEIFWAALAATKPELPRNVVVITGSGQGIVKGGRVAGHWANGRWTLDTGERAHELFIGGEQVARGGFAVAETIIHEAAHALLQARGDASGGTSRQGRYHTKTGFAATAYELGLTPPAKPDSTLGFSDCKLSDSTAIEFAAEIMILDAALSTRIVMVEEAELRAAAVAVGAILGGLNVVVPWWIQEDLSGLWGTLGGGISPTRKPRVRRMAVAFSCGCRTIRVAAADADSFDGLDCRRCGNELERQ